MPGSGIYVLEGRSQADRLMAVLFASYSAQRLPEAKRVAAWITAVARPDGESGAEFEPGADLRGRPAAASLLLRFDQDGRVWVALNDRVDIGRGLARRPPACPILAGIVVLWGATRASLTTLSDPDADRVIEAVTALESSWRGTPGAPDVLSLLIALTDVRDRGVRVQIRVTNTATVSQDRVPEQDSPPKVTQTV